MTISVDVDILIGTDKEKPIGKGYKLNIPIDETKDEAEQIKAAVNTFVQKVVHFRCKKSSLIKIARA